MPRPKIFILAYIVAFAAATGATSVFASESWTVVSETNFYPYNYWEMGRRRGLDAEIVSAVLEDLGVTSIEQTMSWPEVVATVESNGCDLAYQFTEYRFQNPSSTLIKVGPFRTVENVVMTRAGSKIDIRSVDDLVSYRVGVVDGYAYFKAFDENTQIDKLKSVSVTVNFRRLLLGRVDVIVGDRASLRATAEREGKMARVRVLPTVLAYAPRFFAFPKERRDKANRFRASLEKLQRNGIIEEIIRKWLPGGS